MIEFAGMHLCLCRWVAMIEFAGVPVRLGLGVVE
ncbi:hypothetical protein EDD27_3260 [Nonomuraea polychroma]|uniref:Uncharacterized protein n=1 Tax=Nonomuraea polychroma TaxID=46176 RepID=A0A438M5G2_9ACTN|nr:hypothetical protein EDD27_3260 [Nonomuraea polychroma]